MNFVSNMVPARQDWLGWILAFFGRSGESLLEVILVWRIDSPPNQCGGHGLKLNIPIGEHPTLLGIGIQLKTDATSVLPEVVHTPSHPGNKVGPVLSLYSERLVTAEIAVQQ